MDTTITLSLPGDIAAHLAPQNELPRVALEGLALEGYRAGKLTTGQVRRLLGFQTRLQTHEFLKRHQTYLHYDQGDLEQDRIAFEP
jgi:hypothetical protein